MKGFSPGNHDYNLCPNASFLFCQSLAYTMIVLRCNVTFSSTIGSSGVFLCPGEWFAGEIQKKQSQKAEAGCEKEDTSRATYNTIPQSCVTGGPSHNKESPTRVIDGRTCNTDRQSCNIARANRNTGKAYHDTGSSTCITGRASCNTGWQSCVTSWPKESTGTPPGTTGIYKR